MLGMNKWFSISGIIRQYDCKKCMYIRTVLIRRLVIRIGLALRVSLSTVLQNQLALKLAVIGSSTEHCYGFCNFKSSVVESFRRRYML